MDYTWNKNNDTFTATLDVKGKECEPPGCEKQHRGLPACGAKAINISHPSCEPPLAYRLEVPPGKCQVLSICVFTTTARFCVWIVGRRGEGTLAVRGVRGLWGGIGGRGVGGGDWGGGRGRGVPLSCPSGSGDLGGAFCLHPLLASLHLFYCAVCVDQI